MEENSQTQENQNATATSNESASQDSKSKKIAVIDGGLNPTNQTELMAILQTMADGGAFPKIFDTREKLLAAYNMGHSLMGKQWQLALNNMFYVNNKLCIFGELPGTLAERTGEVVEKHIKIFDREYKEISLANKNLEAQPWAATCIIQRKGREKKEFFYTMTEAEKAGQYPPMKDEWVNNKKTGKKIANEESPWWKHTKVMLMRKAQAMAVKFEFPEALVGVPIAEDFDVLPEMRDVSQDAQLAASSDKGEMLNKKFKKVKPEIVNG